MFMRDTNGDDRADERRIILHGFGTEDSHHAIHAFTWGPGGDTVLPGGDVPSFAGRDAAWACACRKRRGLPLRASDRAAATCSSRIPSPTLGPRRRLLGPALHLGCLGRHQLLRHAVFGARRLSAQAAPDEGVDAHEGPPHTGNIEFIRSRQFPRRGARAVSSSTTSSASMAPSSTASSRTARASRASRSSRCCSRRTRTSGPWRCRWDPTARSTSATGSTR